MKKWVLPILGIIGAVVVALIFVSDQKTTPSSSSAPKLVGQSTDNNSQVNTNQSQTVFKIKDQIDFQNRVLTVNSVQRNFVEDGTYSYKPEDGKEFIVVNVMIENRTAKTTSFNPFDFGVENSTGVRTNTSYVGKVSDELHSGDLSAGGSVTGNMAFTVNKGEAGIKLIYKPSFIGDTEVKILLD